MAKELLKQKGKEGVLDMDGKKEDETRLDLMEVIIELLSTRLKNIRPRRRWIVK